MSDSIVLWRMVVVWERKRPILALGAALLVTTLGLNIANIVSEAGFQALPGDLFDDQDSGIIPDDKDSGIIPNEKDSEIISTYGETSIGLAAAFVSLASNLCATALVGLKAWYDIASSFSLNLLLVSFRLHRRQSSLHARSGSRRTIAERFMELLIDSGVVYTTIWVSALVDSFS